MLSPDASFVRSGVALVTSQLGVAQFGRTCLLSSAADTVGFVVGPHALMENRHGLAVGGGISQATGTAERQMALELIDARRRRRRRITLGADKAYDVAPFVHELRGRSVTPHIAIDGHLSKTGKRRKTAVDGRATRHAGYDRSQRCRKRIEEVFGWIKSSAGLAKVKLRGRDRVDAAFRLALVAYNLIRLPKLLAAAA